MILYRTPGHHRGNGGKTYDFKGCTEEEAPELLDNGWYLTLGEAEEGKIKEEVIELDEETLLDQFKENAESLTKVQHVELGKSLGLSLKASWKEATLISKIQEALSVELH